MSLVRTSADARTKAAMRGGAFQRLRGHRDRTLMARGATPIVSVGVARTGAAQNSLAIDPASSEGVVLAWQMSPQARSSMKDGRKT